MLTQVTKRENRLHTNLNQSASKWRPQSPAQRGLMAVSLAIAGLALSGSATHAATVNWSGTATDGNWANGSDWVGGNGPGIGDVASFDQTSYTNLPTSGSSSIGGLQIGDSSGTNSAWMTLNPGQLTVGGYGLYMGPNAGGVTIASPIVLGTTQNWSNWSGNELNITGPVSGSGALTLNNYGLTEFSGMNTLTGQVTIDAGTVGVQNTADGSGNITAGTGTLGTGPMVINGGTINPTQMNWAKAVMTLTNSSQTWNGNFAVHSNANNGNWPNMSGDLSTGTAPVTLNNNIAINITGWSEESWYWAMASLTVGGVISDGGKGYGLTVTGGGTLNLNTNNTYSGNTAIFNGAATFNTAGAFGTGTILLGNSTGANNASLTGNTPVTMSNNIVLQGGNTGTDYISSDYNVWHQGSNFAGTITLGSVVGGVPTPHGLTVNNGNWSGTFISGTIQDPAGLSGPGGSVTINQGGTGSDVYFNGANTFSGGVILNSGGLQLGNLSALGAGTFTINGGNFDNLAAAGTTAFNNPQIWNSDVYFNNEGTLGTEYSLNMGTGPVNLGATGSSSTRNITVGNGTLTIGGAISNGTNGVTNSINLAAGTLVLTGSNTFTGGITVSAGTLEGTTASLPGNIANNGTVVFDQTLGATPIASGTYSGAMSGTGNLTKNNGGTIILTGANTYSGTTTINGGTLKVDASQGGSLPSGAAVTLGGGSTLSLLGNSSGNTTQTLGSLNVSSGANTVVVNGNAGSGTTLALGNLSAAAGTGLNLTKSNSASFTTNTANTNGILDGHIVLYGNDFAANDGSGNVVPATYTALTTGGNSDTNNSLVTDNVTLNGTTTTNSLKITDTQAGQSLTIGGGGTLNVTSGGLLFTGAYDYTIAASTNSPLNSGVGDVIFNQYGTGALTVQAVIVGGGTNVTKNGPGTLIMDPTWTGSWYNAATTTINQGTLRMGNNNGLGGDNANLTIAAGATLDMNGNSNNANNWYVWKVNSAGTIDTTAVGGSPTLYVRAGNISGPIQNTQGSLALNVPDGWGGTLTLTGSNTYSGGTTINDVTLAGNTNGLEGNITTTNPNGTPTVVFDQTQGTSPIASGTYAGAISGPGNVVKNNAGEVIFTGSNTYTGTTTINGGQLTVNGSISGSPVTVNTAGILAGNGTVGSAVLAGGSVNMNLGTVTSLTSTGGGTIGTNTIFTNASIGAGTVKLNSTQSNNGTLTLPAGSGNIIVGPGASVGTADFSAAVGTVNAVNPLAITSTLKVGPTSYVLTGGTSFGAASSNLTDSSTRSVLTLSGGTLTIPTSNSPFHVQTFAAAGSSTTWVAPAGVTSVEYLVVGGGGGGGGSDYNQWGAGGGGAGGLLTGTDTVLPGTAYPVKVGAGGTGGAISGSQNGGTGGVSLFDTYSAGGGGGGGGYQKAGQTGGTGATVGGSGGGSGRDAGTGHAGAAGTPAADGAASYSNAGGSATASGWSAAGGGGGAGSTGYDGTQDQYSWQETPTSSQGGSGISSSITGSTLYYAGGGGGYNSQQLGNGGSAVGGNAGPAGGNGVAGAVATGSGGGGGGQNPGAGGAGGSGVVILAYDSVPGFILPNTNIAATSSSTLDLGATLGQSILGSLSLTTGTASTALTVQDATSLTLSGDSSGNAISATGSTGQNASILAGINAPSLIIGSGQDISVASGVNLTVQPTIGSSSTLLKVGAGTLTLTGSDTYTGGTNVSIGTLSLASANAYPVNSSLTIALAGELKVNTSTGSIFVPQISSLTNSGTIDITNNGLLVHGGSISAITAQVQAGYSGGTWSGAANSSTGVITSSTAQTSTTHLTAVGVATGLSTFEGASVVSSDVEIKYTYYGDANLDGKVDGSDYSIIDSNFLAEQTSHASISGWYNGDFNYDGVINGSDYTLIDNAFNTQGSQIAAEIASPTAQIAGGTSGTSAVPEPTTLGLLGIGALGLLGRRRRN